MNDLPPRQGLYDPLHEHDACGIGFVAHVGGARSHDIVRRGLELLDNMEHRGAAGCDPCTGDGAGILLQLPHELLAERCAATGMELPARGAYGVGMIFLPADASARRECERVLERTVADAGEHFLGWRDVPVDPGVIGWVARESMPAIRQCVITTDRRSTRAFERELYVIRRRVENALAGVPGFYVASMSASTIVYKGMLSPRQLPLFYPDLLDERSRSALVLIHSRFSTNTFPSWARAHPYRFLCHNGEINTLRGNVNWMRVRQGSMSSPLFGSELRYVFPVIGEGQSDSACLDNALELLVRGGRPLAHAMKLLIPPAWEGDTTMDADQRAFHEYSSAIMEPWDGPAAVAFTDGRRVGATLDRNGLRPMRWLVTTDGLVVAASEAGALEFAPGDVRAKGRLRPGEMIMVDTAAGRILGDEEIASEIATRRPYRRWVAEDRIELGELPASTAVPSSERATLRERQRAFGYTAEELRMILAPMAANGEEPVGSMGNDTPLAVLSDEPQLLFKYFKQLFAQVTNPPIDPIREQLVMSLAVLLGPQDDLLGRRRHGVKRVHAKGPVLTDQELENLRALDHGLLRAITIPMLFPALNGAGALDPALDALCRRASSAVRDGHTLLVLSDRGVSDEWAPIPSLLATAAVHHHLAREGLRTRAGLVVESGEAREVAHMALLIGYGANAVCPYLAVETIAELARERELPEQVDVERAQSQYRKALDKGLLKIFSKMGISTARSYCGAQIFEAIGLAAPLVERHFTGTASPVGGIGIEEIAAETLRRHAAAFGAGERDRRVDPGSEYHVRNPGERHGWNPHTISTLQHAAWAGERGYETYREFSRLASEVDARPSSLRALFDFAERDPVPLDSVEPASEIVKRFATGAMSFGALGREAHETLAVAMNRLGARSNSGEGGEEAERYGTDRSSAIKQVASGRFGVTTEYLVSAVELQIKMAQGAKPGEGGQLPGHKVDEVIARTRYSTPGVTLISPPPHHDIYSIEDLAQLIFDLRNVNPRALISVKLVSEAGVGTIAAGVAKAGADLILISGDTGGTGASPLSSIKHAGAPWELGLAETHQTLVLNDLRGRVRVQTDGQLRTGRDVVIAASLGAEEFGFSTAPLIVEGCVMMRKCHLNTCPVGVATQDPVLRAKFRGKPEDLITYFFFVAEEARELMARLGFRTMDELVGRGDVLRPRDVSRHRKARTLDLSLLLHRPAVPPGVATHCVSEREHGLDGVLDREILRGAVPLLERRAPVRLALPIRNTDRAVGAMLSGEIARHLSGESLPDDTIRVAFRGSAGQSFGAFCTRGVTFTLEGEANDYFGKGLSGGWLVVYPPAGSLFIPEETIIVGNVALYGATAGEVYIRGLAGERFAVRNSGATAVVEGVGEHGCEYMTGGVVVVLGKTGRNFAAGMSGGIAYVLNDDGAFEQRCNRGMVELEPVTDRAGQLLLRRLVERHARLTGSARARQLLAAWRGALARFVRVVPVEYRKVLVQREARERAREVTRGG